MAPFYGWGWTTSRLGPLWGGSLLFTTKFPDIPGTHFTNCRRMKGQVDLGATQWFWTQDPRIGDPTTGNPLPPTGDPLHRDWESTTLQLGIHYSLPPNGKDFLYLRHNLQGNVLSSGPHDILSKEFWQHNLATSKFLVKCLLLTASFLSSRKQYDLFSLKHHHHH